MAVPLAAASDDLSGGGIQGGEEGGGAVAEVVVGVALDIAQAQGQGSLGAVQGLVWDFSSTQRTMALSAPRCPGLSR